MFGNKSHTESKKDETALKIDNMKYEIKNLELIAPISGYLHVIDPEQRSDLISPSTALAKIYPSLNNKRPVKLKAFIFPNEISSIHKEQILRMKIVRNVLL